MNKNDCLTIKAVDNGWIVMAHDPNGGQYTHVSQQRVFQTLAELKLFLDEHFSYRKRHVCGDPVDSGNAE